MKIIDKIFKGLLLLVALSLVLVVLPWPMRCQATAQVISRIEGDVVMSTPAQFDCYSPLHKEFWIETSWDFKFVWILVHDNVYPGYSRTITHPLLAADVTKDPILMGASHNVFIGKVLAQTGTTETPAGIRTQYSLEIVSNIKGNLEGTVTVEQEGGIKDGVLQTIEDAFPLLEPGSTYILATRYNKQGNAYTVLANENAGKLLSSDRTKSDADLKTLAAQDEKVKSLEAAYPDEVLLDADIAHQNTRNEFKSLPADKKAAAQSRADSARASLAATAQAQ